MPAPGERRRRGSPEAGPFSSQGRERHGIRRQRRVARRRRRVHPRDDVRPHPGTCVAARVAEALVQLRGMVDASLKKQGLKT
jgi:hypothetical protein